MGKRPCCAKQSIKKGAWSSAEDEILINYIGTHGEGKWRMVAENSGLNRCSKSCRLRWLNYLKPGIKRGRISEDEEDLIIRLHYLLGNRWSLIAGRLPGRTDNEIKNYWNTILVKKLRGQTPRSKCMKQQIKSRDDETYEGYGVWKNNLEARSNSSTCVEEFENPNFSECQDHQVENVIVAPDDQVGQSIADHEVEIFNNQMEEKGIYDDGLNFLMSNEFNNEVLEDDAMESNCLAPPTNDNYSDNIIGGGNDFIVSSSSSTSSEMVKINNENEMKCHHEHTLDLELKKLASFLDLEDEWRK